jgi:hypothetical protein
MCFSGRAFYFVAVSSVIKSVRRRVYGCTTPQNTDSITLKYPMFYVEKIGLVVVLFGLW